MQPTTEQPLSPSTQPSSDMVPAQQQPAARVTVEQLAGLPESPEKNNWIGEMVNAEVARLHYSQDRALARDIAMSGQFADLKDLTFDQAVATCISKQQIGRQWGLNPADSIKSIVFINGRPSLENDIVAGKLEAAGWAWDIDWIEEEIQHKGRPYKKCIGCRIWPKRWNREQQKYLPLLDRHGEPVSVEFNQGDADLAKIWEKGKEIPLSEKWNFRSWGRDMYYWRTISRFKKFHAPNVVRGSFLRDEAEEAQPVAAMHPELLPPELQPAVEPDTPGSLREHVLQQTSLLDADEPEAGK